MKKYRKRTKRRSDTFRVLAQLNKPEPILLRKLVDFLEKLWEIGEKNDLLVIDIKTDDGLWVYHDRKIVFYMHLNRKRWTLLMLNEDFKMYKPHKEQSFLNHCTSKKRTFKQHWRLQEKSEFDAIIEFVKSLDKGKRNIESKSRRSRRMPVEIQKIVIERFEKNGGMCENPHCPIPIEVQKKDGFVFHIDHILPFSKKGTSKSVDNLQILCAYCNLKKNNQLAEYYFR